jgi:hypothetical protein
MKVKLTIDRIEGEEAVLLTDDNTSINWPKKKLPENAYVGMPLEFFISENGQGADDRKLAKEILNEILDNEA